MSSLEGRRGYENYEVEDRGLIALVKYLVDHEKINPLRIVLNISNKQKYLYEELKNQGIFINQTFKVLKYKGVDLFILTVCLTEVEEGIELKSHKAKFKDDGKKQGNTLVLNGTNSCQAVLGFVIFKIENNVITHTNMLTHNEINMLTYPTTVRALKNKAAGKKLSSEEQEFLDFPLVQRALDKSKKCEQNVRIFKYYNKENLLEDHGHLDSSRVMMYDNRFTVSK